MRWCVWTLWFAGSLAVGQEAVRAPGLYAVATDTGRTQPLGAWRCPSVDAAGQFLYALDAAGRVVRWPLDSLGGEPRTVVAAPEPGQPPVVAASVAPTGELLAVLRLHTNRPAGQAPYQRLTLEVLDREAHRVAGPLPLCRADEAPNPALAVAWHPEGQKLAMFVTEAIPVPALYLFEPRVRDWVRGEGSQNPPRPLPVLRWQPNGRTLSYCTGEQLVLRGGAQFAVFRTYPATERLHIWVDLNHLGLLDPTTGLRVIDLEGLPQAPLRGWPGPGGEDLSLPVAGGDGLVWVGPAATAGRLSLWLLPPGEAAPRALLSFDRGGQAYGRTAGPPARHPAAALVFVEVPGVSPPAGGPRPARPPSSAPGTPRSGR